MNNLKHLKTATAAERAEWDLLAADAMIAHCKDNTPTVHGHVLVDGDTVDLVVCHHNETRIWSKSWPRRVAATSVGEGLAELVDTVAKANILLMALGK